MDLEHLFQVKVPHLFIGLIADALLQILPRRVVQEVTLEARRAKIRRTN
jgi:hypothetical protein